jgi:arsenate reductase-like glutaredoxin family protein
MASAYMLVYVREKEAPEIMRGITQEDIPASLVERLDTELKRQQLNKLLSEHNNEFIQMIDKQ